MIDWMYCVGNGRGSCEDATMSKSLPVASLFCWFCKHEVHELVYFLTNSKKWNYVLFCFLLLVTEVKVIYLNDPPFCFWYRNIDVWNFCVGLDGGGRDGWGELRSEPRAAHVFFIFQIKKEYFIFMFQIKSISKVHLSQVVPSSQHHCGRDHHGHLLVQPVHLSQAPTPRLEAWRTS